MKKMIIGIFTAALIAIPATAFAAQSGNTASLNSCCVEATAPCCTINGGSNCCAN